MSLRARLTLRFVSIVVLPVTAVTAYGWQAVARSTQRQIRAELQLARNSAAVAVNARIERAHGAVASLARDPALQRPSVQPRRAGPLHEPARRDPVLDPRPAQAAGGGAGAAVAIETVQLHAGAERLSVTDPLTGAWNYRYFKRRFEQEIERSRRFGRVLALPMLDIDHFKSVNERFGHQRGDEVLVELARRVTGSVGDIDTFARYGGEEFVFILPETNLEGGLAVAEKLRLATHRILLRRGQGRRRPLSVSIGVACFPEHATSPGEQLRAADEALYEARLQGRDRVVTAGPRLLPLTARPARPRPGRSRR